MSSSVFRYVDDVISRIGRMFPDMTIELFRPNGTSAVLLVMTHIAKHCIGVFPPGNRCVSVSHASFSGDPGEGVEGYCCDAFAVHRQNGCSGVQ